MMKTYEIQNLKCGGCATTIEKSLSERFGGVATVDVDAGTVSAEVPDERDLEAQDLLHALGYPVVGAELTRLDSAVTAAKSYVSCVVGRVRSAA